MVWANGLYADCKKGLKILAIYFCQTCKSAIDVSYHTLQHYRQTTSDTTVFAETQMEERVEIKKLQQTVSHDSSEEGILDREESSLQVRLELGRKPPVPTKQYPKRDHYPLNCFLLNCYSNMNCRIWWVLNKHAMYFVFVVTTILRIVLSTNHTC